MSLVLSLWLAGMVAADFGWRRAPNRWLLAGTGLALAALATGQAFTGVTWGGALATAGVAFVFGLAFYAAGLLHAGDVKCLAVLGLWLGSAPMLGVVTLAGLMAGAHSALWLALRWVPRSLGAHRIAHGPARWLAHPDLGRIPYAGYLSLAALLWVTGHAISPGAPA
jgi:prepilin peptidase CpaA